MLKQYIFVVKMTDKTLICTKTTITYEIDLGGKNSLYDKYISLISRASEAVILLQ